MSEYYGPDGRISEPGWTIQQRADKALRLAQELFLRLVGDGHPEAQAAREVFSEVAFLAGYAKAAEELVIKGPGGSIKAITDRINGGGEGS